jgi:hypothetical protein
MDLGKRGAKSATPVFYRGAKSATPVFYINYDLLKNIFFLNAAIGSLPRRALLIACNFT